MIVANHSQLASSIGDFARQLGGFQPPKKDAAKGGLFGRLEVDDECRRRCPPDSDYNALKERVHLALLNRLNLDRLNRVGRSEAEPELRGLIIGLLDAEKEQTPLSLSERESLITDVFHELFGLGPLEALLSRSDRCRTSWSIAST